MYEAAKEAYLEGLTGLDGRITQKDVSTRIGEVYLGGLSIGELSWEGRVEALKWGLGEEADKGTRVGSVWCFRKRGDVLGEKFSSRRAEVAW